MKQSDCKFEKALEILVGKWKPIILFKLFSKDKTRFGELQKSIPELTKAMLMQQLEELEYYNIIDREQVHQVPSEAVYSISDYGRGVIAVVTEKSITMKRL